MCGSCAVCVCVGVCLNAYVVVCLVPRVCVYVFSWLSVCASVCVVQCVCMCYMFAQFCL